MSGFPWLAAISGGASGASRGLNDVIGVLNKAADDKRSDARYAEERDFRNRQLDAELARAGIFPENEADGQQPPVDKGVLAAGRPNFSAMGAERTAPTSLFEGVQPSLDPSGFSITRRSLDSAASNKPLGSDVATASADLFKDGSARTPLTAVGPSPVRPSHPADQTLELPSSRATSASPLHTALSVAQGATDGAPVVTIGGKRFVVDESRTPEGRRMRAQIQKEEQVRNAKLAERRSILQQLRRSRPQRYGQLSDELIEAAAADDDVFHQVVLPKDDPFELHVRERDYDAAHPLSGEGGHNWQVVQTDDGIQQVDPRTGQTRRRCRARRTTGSPEATGGDSAGDREEQAGNCDDRRCADEVTAASGRGWLPAWPNRRCRSASGSRGRRRTRRDRRHWLARTAQSIWCCGHGVRVAAVGTIRSARDR
jgi:hypothetical protein